MPDLNEIKVTNFALNTTVSDFDCRVFDHAHYQIVHNSLTVDGAYSCHAFAPGSTNDTAKHWKPPHRLSKGALIAIIVIASLVGLVIAVIFLRWVNRRCRTRPQPVKRGGNPRRTAGRRSPSYKPVVKS